MKIILIGMMGCGKSTIGKLLSLRLNIDFIDMDDYIEKQSNMSISDMFKISQQYFRYKETQACIDLADYKDCVIASGGGIITNQDNLRYLRNNSIIIYIDRKIEDIITDIDVSQRPLLQEGTHVLYELYKTRDPLYQQSCDYRIYNDGSINDITDKIMNIEEIKQYYCNHNHNYIK